MRLKKQGIFVVTITRQHPLMKVPVLKRVWLVRANSCESALKTFRDLNASEEREGEPLILPGEEISAEPLEFCRGVAQVY